MQNQMIFKRYELKYLITSEQCARIQEALTQYMKPDKHGRSTIQSLYFDTPDFLLVRRSIDKPFYKEKLRLRSYGVAQANSEVFMEIKKKYDSVVYKRRESMTEAESVQYIKTKCAPYDSQIFHEIDYVLNHYDHIAPAMLITYEREAFYGKDNHDLRITFDSNILWRNSNLDLKAGIYGWPVIASDLRLMEIKVANAMPLWLVDILSSNHIYKTNFSKYGTAYKQFCKQQSLGGLRQYA